MNKQLNKISEISNLDYVGYYWLSDSDKPERIQSVQELEKYEKDGEPTNPFILEAALYSEDSNASVSVRHSDGRYLINEFEISKFQTANHSYLANASLSKNINLTELWLEETDENCEDMKVLTKKAVVFTGFKEV